MATVNCPSWIVAKALQCLCEYYHIWEVNRDMPIPYLRRFGLLAKTTGLVAHDRMLQIGAAWNEL